MWEWRLHAGELRDSYETALREAVAAGGAVFGDVDVVPELRGTGVEYIVSLEMPSGTVTDLNRATSIFNRQGGQLAAPHNSWEDRRRGIAPGRRRRARTSPQSDPGQ